MKNTTNLSDNVVVYENFVCYFENDYFKELSTHRIYERRISFLTQIKQIAAEHKRLYELRHGKGSYHLNLGKYGALERTPLQIIEGDLNCTHLLMPKISHNYVTRFGYSHYSLRRFA